MHHYLDELKGILGFIVAMAMPSITVIDWSLRTLAAVGGIVLLYVSIRHKMILIKKDRKELEEGRKTAKNK